MMTTPDTPAPARVELYRSRNAIGRQRWRFRTRARNGRILTAAAEAYVNRADALRAIDLAHPGLPVVEVDR